MLLDKNNLLIIGFIPRSGSNYLCDILVAARGFGIPREYYYPLDFAKRLESWHKYKHLEKEWNPIKWFKFVVSQGAAKLSWHAHEQMLIETGTLCERINKKYIFLTRDDKLLQAISWYRALETNQWTSLDPIRPQPEFNKNNIDKTLFWIENQERSWIEYLTDKDHIHLSYEQLCNDVDGTITKIEKFTGLKRKRSDTEVAYVKQRDQLTAEWVKKYHEACTASRPNNHPT